jgi:polysaccharide biosynthesis protein PslH
MKVLMLTQVLPYPPDSGPKVKTWNVIKHLAKNHEVYLVSFVRGDQSKDIEFLSRICKAVYALPIIRNPLYDIWALIVSLLSGQPWMMVRDDRLVMRQLISHLSGQTQFDVVHADQLNMAQYAVRVPNARKILDMHNALWLLYKRLAKTMESGPKKWLLERDWRLLKQYEGKMCREFDGLLTVSSEDKTALEEAMGYSADNKLRIVPIAVDTDENHPIKRKPDAAHILSIGTMYWPPNIDGILWFLKEILPLIRVRYPDVIFDVVGARPPKEIEVFSCNDKGVRVTGYIEDVTPFLAEAGVMIVPLRSGGGMRVKILNAMAQALPVITTAIGCEGIEVDPGKHLLIANTPGDFADAVINLLGNRELAEKIGGQGRLLVEQKYDYRLVGHLIDEIYQEGK